MNLHAQIMNLPVADYVEALDDSPRLQYKQGHRDARHAAAELALQADAEIERLRAELQRLSDAILALPYSPRPALLDQSAIGPETIATCFWRDGFSEARHLAATIVQDALRGE